ncbi:MAG: hypothetical protein M5R36_07995 [Deltaproteobacteria bacterium]|nr:hypothetical protein [Deltaproteobacteria bacterium]
MTRRDEAELGRIARFTISAYMPVRQWNNLDDEEPSYRLWLVDADGRKVAPDRITVVKLETRAERLYFPIVHEWAKNYSVEFPLRDDDGELLRLSGGRVTLLAAGIQGTARLEWDVP